VSVKRLISTKLGRAEVATVQPKDFAGRVAAVTGASSDLGRSIAGYLTARGAAVVVNDLETSSVGACVDEIVGMGGVVTVVEGSLADRLVADALVAGAMDQHGRLDILVNTPVGVGAGYGLAQSSDGDAASFIEENVLGPMWASRAALSAMRIRGAGRIVNVSVGIGAFGMAGCIVSSTASAAVVGLTRAMALDVSSTSIRVNCVAPIADTAQSAILFERSSDVDRSRYGVELVTPTIAFLCHDACSLNGTVLSAGGGRVALVFSATSAGSFDLEADHLEIGRQLDRILASDHPTLPRSVLDELLLIEV
jgi:NAD(P)-dependent dehydrogenase (short-subunit alcohol dehydrogenase family)